MKIINTKFTIIACMLGLASIARAEKPLPSSLVDYDGFVKLGEDISQIRIERLVALDTFLEMANDPDTVILDTRSKAAYDYKHIAGAVHLNFSDFTSAKLAKVIPSKDTRVLIYCNNNIEGDVRGFPTKIARVALNIPTFINLYEYGYHNVYELSDLVQADHAKLNFSGSHLTLFPQP